jgi:hypothetical protein
LHLLSVEKQPRQNLEAAILIDDRLRLGLESGAGRR